MSTVQISNKVHRKDKGFNNLKYKCYSLFIETISSQEQVKSQLQDAEKSCGSPWLETLPRDVTLQSLSLVRKCNPL